MDPNADVRVPATGDTSPEAEPSQVVFNENTVGLYTPLIPEYHGEKSKDISVQMFISSIEEIAQLCNWPDRITRWVLRGKLKGKAACFFEQRVEVETDRTFLRAKQLLLGKYAAQEDSDAWKLLFDCRCFPGETTTDYHRRLMHLQDRCNAGAHTRDGSYVGSDKVLEIFLNGIPNRIKEHMVVINPRTLDEALSWTNLIESRLNKLNTPKPSTMATHTSEINDEDSEDEVTYSLATVSIRDKRPAAKAGAVAGREGVRNKNPTQSRSNADRETQGATQTEDKPTLNATGAIEKNYPKRVVRDSTLRNSTETGKKLTTQNKHLIALRVRGRTLRCLLDPASDLSLISHDTVRALHLNHKVVKNKPLEIRSALNSTSSLEQSIDLYFTLAKGNNQYIHTFHLLNSDEILGYSAIVGIDFLVANSAIVDYKNLEVSMWGEVVAMLEPLVGKPPSIEIIIARYYSDEEWGVHLNKCNAMKGDKVEVMTTVAKIGQPQEDYLDEILRKTQLTGADRTALTDICIKYRDVFVQNGPVLGVIKNYSHSVRLTDETPIKMPQYQVPVKIREQFKKKLQEYEEGGIIERSNSPWNVPMFARLKRNGDLRLVLDATAINKRTQKIDYPIFRIDDTFNQLEGKAWFTNVDLRNGYHQIILDAKSRKYFAFRTPHGKYQYRRMPMGASNSGIFFQMVMETLLRDLIGNNLIVYQDDLLIATTTIAEHMGILEKVLEIFARENILINNEKSRFLVREVNFLGHVLRDGTFSPSNENLEALRMLSPPTSLKQLRSFIGKINFYAKFLPALSDVISPLTDLLSTGRKKFMWEAIHDQVFDRVQVMLSSSPILHYPNYSLKFVISIQVSDSALIGVLEQGEGTALYPIGYYSKKLNKAQRNYNVLEVNALAVISVLEHFHHMIIGYPVEVCSDRKAIEYLRNLKDGNTRITDWITKISKYSPNFVFSKNSKAITNILRLRTSSKSVQKYQESSCLPTAFTDGSCTGNGTASARTGVGVHWENCSLPDYYGQPDNCLTNNKAELVAIIHAMETAIEAGYKHIRIVSDSMYAIENINNNMTVWEQQKWMSARNKLVENLTEFKTIRDLQKTLSVTWEYTPGHAECKGNNAAHELAAKGRMEVTKPQPGPASESPLSSNPPELLAIRTKGSPLAKIVSLDTIKEEQGKDDQIGKFEKEGTILDTEPEYIKGIWLYHDPDKGVYAKGIINIAPKQDVQVNAIYVPECLRIHVIAGIHECKWVNHSGYMTTCTRLLEKYFWSSFRRDIRNYIHTCEVCQKNSPPRKKIEVLDFVKPSKPGQKVALDIIGPIVTATEGHKYILTMIDMFTRYTVLCPLKNIKAEEVITCLERDYITIFGVPRCIVTDRGSNFRSEIFTQACQVLQIKHYMSSPYHPATNGMVERLNKEVKRKLTTLCNNAGRCWATKLHLVQFAQNNSYHGSLNASPNTLTFGEDRSFPDWGFYEAHPMQLGSPEEYVDNLRKNLNEIRELAWEFEEDTRRKRNEYINKNRVVPRFDMGDLVLYRSVKRGKTRNSGFQYIYDGPYEVKKRLSPVSYDIGIEGDSGVKSLTKRAHVERLRPFYKATIKADEPLPCLTNKTTEQSPETAVDAPVDSRETERLNTVVTDDSVHTQVDSPDQADGTTGQEFSDTHEAPGKADTQTTTHNHYTRSKTNSQRKCYKHLQADSCKCNK